MPASSVFISYSRIDKELVAPIVATLRLATVVFRDEEDIAPGQKWSERIESALQTCDTIIVFWSCASRESKYVEHECRIGVCLGKAVIPVLLDGTPLSEDLSFYQALDFRPFLKSAADRALRLNYSSGLPLIPLIVGSLALGIVRAMRYANAFKEGREIEFSEAESLAMFNEFNALRGKLGSNAA